MPYQLAYHPRVVERDLRRIPAAQRARISRAIETKLASEPDRYSEPLHGTLLGYRKLRIGDFRVVLAVRADEVWILAIVHRKDIYAEAVRRL